MDLPEFQNKLRKIHGINRQINYVLCFAMIGVGFIPMYIGATSGKSMSLLWQIIWAISMIAIGIYGIVVMARKQRPDIWVNSLSKKENILLLDRLMKAYAKKPGIIEPDHQQFIYRKSWWQLTYSVHLFAGDHLIAVKADSTRGGEDGIVDLGAARRLEQKIIRTAKELAKLNFPERISELHHS